MTNPTPPKTRRSVVARRTIALGTSLATAALGSGAMAATVVPRPDSVQHAQVHLVQQDAAESNIPAGGEGEGAVPEDPKILLLRNIGRYEGHLYAAMALAEAGDITAVKIHIAHTSGGEFDAVIDEVSDQVAEFPEQLAALIRSLGDGNSADALRQAFADIQNTFNAVRAQMSPHDQAIALAALMRHAGESYGIATAGDMVSDVSEYQASWGYIKVVAAQAQAMSRSVDNRVATAGEKILGYLDATAPAFGDLQGEGITDMRASLIYGAAARIELAALGLQ